MSRENLPERIERIIRSWDQWSPHERRHMDAIVDEILEHVRDGTGNRFVASWCDKVLAPALKREGVR